MRLIYSDEAGKAELVKEPTVVVAAVLVHADRQWASIRRDVQLILDEFVPPARHDTFEFHANVLFKRRHRQGGRTAEILRRLLGIIRKHELPIAAGSVDRDLPDLKGSVEKAQQFAFAVCALVVERTFRRSFPDETGLWVADECRAKTGMKKTLRWYQKAAIFMNEPSSQLDHIIDTISFADSHDSLGLQLADHCNFFVKTHLAGNKDAEEFYDIIKKQVHLVDLHTSGGTTS